jgi:hypothetical protein
MINKIEILIVKIFGKKVATNKYVLGGYYYEL